VVVVAAARLQHDECLASCSASARQRTRSLLHCRCMLRYEAEVCSSKEYGVETSESLSTDGNKCVAVGNESRRAGVDGRLVVASADVNNITLSPTTRRSNGNSSYWSCGPGRNIAYAQASPANAIPGDPNFTGVAVSGVP
jgi:hypothetical protein